MPLIGRLEARGPDVVAATPELDFVLAVLVGGLLLVQALERAIVPLVQPPAALDRNPRHLHLRERELRGLDRAQQQRLMDDTRPQPGLLHLSSGIDRFLDAAVAQRHVRPAREEILEIPRALAVPQQNQDPGIWFSDGFHLLPTCGEVARSAGGAAPEGLRRRARLAMAIDLSRDPHVVSELRSIETPPADEATV